MRWELLDRYLLGQCSLAERAEVERWLAESPARRRLIEQLATPDEPDTEDARARKASVWARLERELDSGLKRMGDDA